MAIQFYDGVILFNSGQIAMDPACCCGTPGDDCAYCPPGGTPYQLDISITGVVPNDCDIEVGDWPLVPARVTYENGFDPNGTFRLTQDAEDACLWALAVPNAISYRVFATQAHCDADDPVQYDSVIPRTVNFWIRRVSDTQWWIWAVTEGYNFSIFDGTNQLITQACTFPINKNNVPENAGYGVIFQGGSAVITPV